MLSTILEEFLLDLPGWVLDETLGIK